MLCKLDLFRLIFESTSAKQNIRTLKFFRTIFLKKIVINFHISIQVISRLRLYWEGKSSTQTLKEVRFFQRLIAVFPGNAPIPTLQNFYEQI